MTARKPTEAERAAEIAKMDLRSPAETKKRADAMLRNMLANPPAPHTPKAKPKKRSK